MRHRPSRAAAAGLAALALAVALPALGQEAPESLLPEGFGDPAPPPSTTPAAPPPGAPADLLPTVDLAPPDANATDEAGNELADVEEEEADIPVAARRDPAAVGPLGSDGLGDDPFGRADGRFLSSLMRLTDAPIASRWASMLLRRALMIRAPVPRGVSPADWVAERAWLLVRMGEADAARMMVDSVDVEDFTPKLLGITAQAALATADPAAFCPLTVIAETMSDEPAWPMARAVCAGLAGEPTIASQLISQLRRRDPARGIDLLLAEKLVGAGANGRRAVNIEWEPVDQLTSWRFGTAMATGVAIPDRLYATVGPHVRAWAARAPMLSVEDRVAPALVAARLGVFSNATLVDLYGAVADRTDPLELGDSDAGRLRAAYVGADADARLDAMRQLWSRREGRDDRYETAILLARAALRVAPSAAHGSDVPMLLSAMLSAGFDRGADRWTPIVRDLSGDDGALAWGLIATGSERPAVAGGTAMIRDMLEDGEHRVRGQLLAAAMIGLGRVPEGERADLAGEAGFDPGLRNRYTRALDLAVRAGQPGTVALLAAVGLQTADWRGVPPAHLCALIRALREVGLDGEARMIAAEAVARS